MKIKVLSAAVTVLLSVATAGVVLAGQPDRAALTCTRSGTAAGKRVSAAALNETVGELGSKGASGAEIGRALESRWCLDRIATMDYQLAGHSQPADVTFDGMFLFQEPESHAYYAIATYKWRTDSYLADESESLCSQDDVGGLDGLGIRVAPGDCYLAVDASASFW